MVSGTHYKLIQKLMIKGTHNNTNISVWGINMNILVACEYSGVVRDAFLKKGHTVLSCDLLPGDSPGPHYQGDIFDILYKEWDMLIAHPPCTYLANSGVQHLHKDVDRVINMIDGAAFFRALLEAPIKYKCVENPIMHKYARALIGGVPYDQVIQPWMFGHMETKTTCLWLSELPLLVSADNVRDEMKLLPKREQQRLYYLPPSPDRWKIRSTTYQGIANAMAEQWG